MSRRRRAGSQLTAGSMPLPLATTPSVRSATPSPGTSSRGGASNTSRTPSGRSTGFVPHLGEPCLSGALLALLDARTEPLVLGAVLRVDVVPVGPVEVPVLAHVTVGVDDDMSVVSHDSTPRRLASAQLGLATGRRSRESRPARRVRRRCPTRRAPAPAGTGGWTSPGAPGACPMSGRRWIPRRRSTNGRERS